MPSFKQQWVSTQHASQSPAGLVLIKKDRLLESTPGTSDLVNVVPEKFHF